MSTCRKRIHQLHKTYTDFPAPLSVLATGPVWDARDIRAWLNVSNQSRVTSPRRYGARAAHKLHGYGDKLGPHPRPVHSPLRLTRNKLGAPPTRRSYAEASRIHHRQRGVLMAKGRLFYGAATFEIDDADKTTEAIAAALDGNTLFVDIETTGGLLRVFLGNSVGVAVLSLAEG